MLLIGVDTGGTFTDFIWRDGDQWGEHKRLSTPHDPAEAVLAGINHIAGAKPFRLVHGSTVSTNAILERKGARTALVTNRRFEDVVEIARQNRPDLYDFACRKSEPLVPRELRFGVSGRIDCSGEAIEPLDPSELPPLVQALKEAGAESIAVCLLFSFAHPEHEQAVREALKELHIPISLSHEVLREFREYERASTTLINAYVAPKMQQYITHLQTDVGDNPFRIMQSNGGSISARTAMEESVRTILSGPAGGAVGAQVLGRQAGYHKLITFDMGGTSTDVALIDGHLPLTMESSIADLPVKVPMIDIHTVGAGGGSIASKDTGGALQVGPESAGADPGPICYGKGERVTVTDANLYLGRLVPEAFLGGHMTLDAERLDGPMEALAHELGVTPVELAEGVLAVANANMERAIKVISVERGYDPREFSLLSFGGAGGLHAAELARSLHIPQVLIPLNPGILSACGMVLADVIKDYSQTVMLRGEEAEKADFDNLYAALEQQAERDMAREGFVDGQVRLERYLDMRYQGQSFELLVPLTDDFVAQFHELHERSYGYSHEGKPVETVNLRLRAVGPGEREHLVPQELGSREPSEEALVVEKPVVFDGRCEQTRVYRREKLVPGNIFDGPAIVVEYSSTIVVPPWARVEVDAFANLLLIIPEEACQ